MKLSLEEKVKIIEEIFSKRTLHSLGHKGAALDVAEAIEEKLINNFDQLNFLNSDSYKRMKETFYEAERAFEVALLKHQLFMNRSSEKISELDHLKNEESKIREALRNCRVKIQDLKNADESRFSKYRETLECARCHIDLNKSNGFCPEFIDCKISDTFNKHTFTFTPSKK